MKIVWDNRFKRAFRKLIRKNKLLLKPITLTGKTFDLMYEVLLHPDAQNVYARLLRAVENVKKRQNLVEVNLQILQ